jgi:hypothetical protein
MMIMAKFKVRMLGTHPCWPSDWVVGRNIKLLKCIFARSSSDQTHNLSIEIELDAQDESKAMNLGKDIISKEFDLFALCAENPLNLDNNHIWIDEM